METQIMVESFPLLGMCNLCLNDGAVKSMIVEYKRNGTKELYSEMLLKCYSIDVTTLDLGDTKRLICDSCISKLKGAVHFREQVETSLKTLEEAVKSQALKKEPVTLNELDIEEDLPYGYISDSGDNSLLSDFTIKKEDLITEDPPKRLRRCTKKSSKLKTKVIKLSVKKPGQSKEIESMLKCGLFPFKIRKDNIFSCAICSEKSRNLDEIKSHTLEHSTELIHVAFRKMMFISTQRFYKCAGKLRCKICTADIANYEELKSHIDNCSRLKYSKNNWNNLPFKLEKDQLDCPVCKKTFINFVSLNTHMNLHYPNYICENCGKAFASKARLRGHIRTHEIGEFPCRYCDMVFDKVTKRENHVSKEHKSGIRYACKRCNISLSSFYARQKHLAEVHNEELKRYKCKACTQSYITPGHLSSHVRRDHLNERNHKCSKCDLAFYTRNSLKMHMIKHDGERIHVCPVCQKSYQRKKTLREHMRIHNNDKRFVCPVCGRAFTQKCTLKGHLKVHERKVELDDRALPVHSI